VYILTKQMEMAYTNDKLNRVQNTLGYELLLPNDFSCIPEKMVCMFYFLKLYIA
jgi:hypothetical protein